MNIIETYIQKAIHQFSRKEYEQYISPIVKAFEQKMKNDIDFNIRRKLEIAKASIADSILHKKEVINGKDYITFDAVITSIEEEINNLL
jgi:hypothetical protein